MSNHVHLTRAGYERLKAELEDLKGPQRQRIAEAIREAKSHGDLKENAAYHEAKLNQQRLEARIGDLEKQYQLAKISEGPDENDKSAQMGSKVTLKDLKFDDEFDITLSAAYEADPGKGRISINAPLGAAVFGQIEGAELQVETPDGSQSYRILRIVTEA